MTVLSARLEQGYLGFASYEAKGNSPTYEQWANHIAASPDYHEFLETLPQAKQQPNLLFAAIRWVTGRRPLPPLRNGQSRAWTGPHGQSLEWID